MYFANILRISVKEITPVNLPDILAPAIAEAGRDVEKPEAEPHEQLEKKMETLVANTAGESILEATVEKKNDGNDVEPVNVNDEVKA